MDTPALLLVPANIFLCPLQVMEGRKPTGGKLEVKVRLREPLSGQDMQTVTENWLVLEPRGL